MYTATFNDPNQKPETVECETHSEAHDWLIGKFQGLYFIDYGNSFKGMNVWSADSSPAHTFTGQILLQS